MGKMTIYKKKGIEYCKKKYQGHLWIELLSCIIKRPFKILLQSKLFYKFKKTTYIYIVGLVEVFYGNKIF